MTDHCSSSVWKCGHRVGLFFVGMIILCFFWYGVNSQGRVLHIQLLQSSFLWFKGMDGMSMLLAAIQVYIYGYIVAGVWELSGCCGKSKKNDNSGSCCSSEKK